MGMRPYPNQSGVSGVIAYETGPDFIDVRFRSGTVYRYTPASAGTWQFKKMKQLAKTGRGLSTFISRFVKDGYEH